MTRTTPEAIDLQHTFREMLDAGDRSCAMEASSHASALKRLVGVRFASLVFTNLSQDHLDFHGSMDEYFEAKRRLFVEPGPEGRRPSAVVNLADAHGRRLAEELRALGEPPSHSGSPPTPRSARATWTSARARSSRSRPDFGSAPGFGGASTSRTSSAPSRRRLGIDDGSIRRGVEHVQGVPGRFEAVDEGQSFAVLVDYAHTPEALENVLVEARACFAPRHLRLRLRRRSRSGKASAHGRRRHAPGRLGRHHIGQPAQRGSACDHRRDRRWRRAGRHGRARPRRGDRASSSGRRGGRRRCRSGEGHEPGQEIAGRTILFDDREVARDALRRVAARVSA